MSWKFAYKFRSFMMLQGGRSACLGLMRSRGEAAAFPRGGKTVSAGRWPLLLAAVVLAGAMVSCAQEARYYSGPKVLDGGGPKALIPARETFTFVVIGDTRSGVAVFKRHIEEINLLDPDFVIDVGDMIPGYVDDTEGIEAMWDEFDEIVDGLAVPLVMVVGNHDAWKKNPVSSEIYSRRYGKRRFSFDHKGAHFIVLDSEATEKNDHIAADQRQWLAEDLAAHRGARATFVFLHRPFWIDRYTFAGAAKRWFENVHPLLVKYGVSAVFGGHEHLYASFPVKDGIHYYITGGGGANLEAEESDGGFHHYCLVTVRGDQWRMAVIRQGAVKPPTVTTRPWK